EERAQPVEFLLLAEFFRADRLVELRGEDLVVDLFRKIGEGVVLALGLAGRLGFLVVVVGELVGGGVGRLHLAGLLLAFGTVLFLGLRLVGTGVVLATLVAAFLALRLRFLAVLGLVRLLLVAEVLGHFHGGKHLANDAGKRLLVIDI